MTEKTPTTETKEAKDKVIVHGTPTEKEKDAKEKPAGKKKKAAAARRAAAAKTAAEAAAANEAADASCEPDELPALGDMVHFVVPRAMTNREEATHRAAIVSHVHTHGKKGLIDCHVLICPHDYPANYHPGPILLATRVEYEESGEKDGTWHCRDCDDADDE